MSPLNHSDMFKVTKCSNRIRMNFTSFSLFYICIILNTILQIPVFFILATVAFHTVLIPDPTIPYGSPVLFDEVLLNKGDG